ncbi:hypothetical protein INT43_001780 [Umbelopsis isabellina]|uniref:Uncharacterized protein n=1 Tax=Mortierella isabellina TaxID=91625 RepID=A0A8H7PS84_MORIS|nr:hypothetical protein INT43_001780 [Umbelopsis isabellina]
MDGYDKLLAENMALQKNVAELDAQLAAEYEIAYIPKNRKLTRSEIRSRLRDVGIDTTRVLDIIYPARDVIGLLVHVQYRALLKETLLQKKIETIDSFDPLDPKHIADPRHASLGTGDRCRLAVALLRERLSMVWSHNTFGNNCLWWRTMAFTCGLTHLYNVLCPRTMKKQGFTSLKLFVGRGPLRVHIHLRGSILQTRSQESMSYWL